LAELGLKLFHRSAAEIDPPGAHYSLIGITRGYAVLLIVVLTERSVSKHTL